MLVTINGEDRTVADGASVRELLDALGATSPALAGGGRGVAVAIGGEVVPRSAWSTTVLQAGAVVEVLVAVQGG